METQLENRVLPSRKFYKRMLQKAVSPRAWWEADELEAKRHVVTST